MLVERNYGGTRWLYLVIEGIIYRGWKTQGVMAARGKH
jgi:hypothetical protein